MDHVIYKKFSYEGELWVTLECSGVAEIRGLLVGARTKTTLHERDNIHQERPSTPQIKPPDPSTLLPRCRGSHPCWWTRTEFQQSIFHSTPHHSASRHPITRLIIRSEHLRLLHTGPTLLSCSLNRRFHIIGGRKIIRSVTRACVTCRRHAAKPQSQMMGQVPTERVTPDLVFDRVGVDYAGPLQLKLGSTRKPVIVESCVCVFVSLFEQCVWNLYHI